MKKFNLNDKVKVKLTPLGVDIFYHQFDDLNKTITARGCKPIKNNMPQIDGNGYTEFQLWHFIELYGNHIGIAKENVISDLSLYIDEKDLEAVE